MFNFDNISCPNFYGDQFSSYGYVYGAPCYYSDNSNYAYNFAEGSVQATPYYNPSAYTYSCIPNYKPVENDEKCPTKATRDSEIQEDQEDKEEIQVPVTIVKSEELEEEPIKLEQKYGRNITSNVFHSIIRWASYEEEFQKIIQSVITANRLTINKSQFRQKLKERTCHLKGYVNTKTIKGLYLGRKIGATRLDLQFSKILRILSRIYIKKYHIEHIYFSSKIKKKSRSLHFKRMRVLLKMIK